MSDFHRSNPAPGVRVDAVPRDRVHISQMQRRLARTPETNHKGEYAGVFKTHMLGGATGLGMMSTVKTLRKLKSTKGSRKALANTCFANRFPTKLQLDKDRMEDAFRCLREDHLHLCVAKGNTAPAEDRYERMREAFLFDWPMQEKRLDQMEDAHNRSIK